MTHLKIKCITCEALARPVYLCAAQSPHTIDVELVQWGLHRTPAHLRQILQARIDAVGSEYAALTLVYGLCGQSTAGLVARNQPLVLPRAHDCITLFLGSRERYQDQFENYPGTYWYAQDYVERDDGSGSSLSIGAGTDSQIDATYDEYVQKFGKDNADYLMEVMGAWHQYYKRAAFIDMGTGDTSSVEAIAQAEAGRRGWTFQRLAGDLRLIRRLLAGDWQAEFLVLQPGEQVAMSYDEGIIKAT